MIITVFLAISLDGFIADENGTVDWLQQLPPSSDPNEDYGYAELVEKADILVMGRKTYEQVLGFGEWPYQKLPVTVLTHKPTLPQPKNNEQVDFASGQPSELIQDFESKGIQHIYLDGGDVIQQFLSEDLIHEFILTQVPVLLGNGIPLFIEPLKMDAWDLSNTTLYKNGFVQRHFVKK